MNKNIKNPTKGEQIKIISESKEVVKILATEGKISTQKFDDICKKDNLTIKTYPNLTELGIDNDDIEESIKNIQIISIHLNKALVNNYYFEFISLSLQIIDLYLRIYYSYHAKKTVSPKHAFGDLIKLCKDKSFNKTLAKKISTFNTMRVHSIHHFILGKITIEEIEVKITEYKNLHTEVVWYVQNNSGKIINKK